MRPFKKITGMMAYLPIQNIDTDMIIPKQYLKTIKRTGLGKYLFSEMRFDEFGAPKPEFILNQSAYQNAKILLVEENFGCGSSREHAVWSLMDFGIQVVIAPSFSDIFYSNSFKNGLLPIIVPHQQIEILSQKTVLPITIDLIKKQISVDSLKIPFSIEEYRRQMLLKGLDEIGETLLIEEKITAFEIRQKNKNPWLYFGE